MNRTFFLSQPTVPCNDNLVGVEYGDTMIVVGEDDTILEFDTATYEFIIRSETTINEAQYRGATMVTPGLLKC